MFAEHLASTKQAPGAGIQNGIRHGVCPWGTHIFKV